ncbi:fructose-1,6-bisphosphatase [Enterococcus sp. LJL98]
MEEKYFKLLKSHFAEKEEVLTEIINLEAILHLPKGTEHFVSDIHGEYAAFNHVLRNGSGSVRAKVEECFKNEPHVAVTDLCTLIYYPKEKIARQQQEMTSKKDLQNWYREQIWRLIQVLDYAGKKYTRSKMRKTFPKKFAYIMEELLNSLGSQTDKQAYYTSIVEKIIELNQAPHLLRALAETIQRLVVDHLHVVGDIYDRGPQPDAIMERLLTLPSIDIQWGNHDIIWLAAMGGSQVALVNLIRIQARYGNLAILEESYGVHLRPLIEYSQKYYTPQKPFSPVIDEDNAFSLNEKDLCNQIQQACALLQFKLEGQLIKRRPEFQMQERAVLEKIDYHQATIERNGQCYPLEDFFAPTVDPSNPCRLTDEEKALLVQLLTNYQDSEKLKRHMDFLYEKGRMYLCYNENLLLHGCIPLHANGDFKSLRIAEKSYAGKELLDFYQAQVEACYAQPKISEDFATDLMWYLWAGENSSLFGKKAMTTFERYYIADPASHVEEKNAYYVLRNDEDICEAILTAFHLPKTGHIINGHTPVKEKKGESPMKANRRMLVIDGGFAKAYQKTTGIAGYTLLSNSYGMLLAAHQPFTSVEDAVENGTDIVSTLRVVEQVSTRKKVAETNIGEKLKQESQDLLYLYQHFDRL